MRVRGFGWIVFAIGSASGVAEAKHFTWAIEEQGHAVPLTLAPTTNQPVLRFGPPNPSGDCQPEDAITGTNGRTAQTYADKEAQFDAECVPFGSTVATISDPAIAHSKASCCLQYEIGPRKVLHGETPIRGYQLVFGGAGGWVMDQSGNDDYACAYAALANDTNLDSDPKEAGKTTRPTYEYMVGFEFWQQSGSHHFILFDLLGAYNDPAKERDCGTNKTCQDFNNLPSTYSVDTPVDELACGGAAGAMRSVPLAGSPGPEYFPVPYPDDVGIKISRNHIFRMQHHVYRQGYDPQLGKVWINLYTAPAFKPEGTKNIAKEGHILFDGSGIFFLIPPHTIAHTQGVWTATRNIDLYGMTAHSHKRNILFTADLVGVDGEPQSLPVRSYQYSHPYCGGLARTPACPSCQPQANDPIDYTNPPMHLYESTDWSDHEACPFWREDGDNDGAGAIRIKQGEAIRYECWVNNGILPFQSLYGVSDASPDPVVGSLLGTATGIAEARLGSFPARTLAVQPVRIEPRNIFDKPQRGKYSCEEIGSKTACEKAGGGAACNDLPPEAPGVIPGVPVFGAVGFYQNRACLPDALTHTDPDTGQRVANDASEDVKTPEIALFGGPSADCPAGDDWQQFDGEYSGYSFPSFITDRTRGKYTGKCVPASIGFAESEDDEMCILLAFYTFADDPGVPIGPERPYTDVGR